MPKLKQIPPLTQRLAQIGRDLVSDSMLIARGEEAKKTNSSVLAEGLNKMADPNDTNREPWPERVFVRKFGDKVKKVRYSNRSDFVGLTVLGRSEGFIITKDKAGKRRLRLIDIDEQGHAHITTRFLELKKYDSACNLQRGLLRWVR